MNCEKIGIAPRLDRRWCRTQSAKPSLSAFRTYAATAIAPAKHPAKVCDRRRTRVVEDCPEPHRRTCCCSRSAVSAHATTVRMLRWSVCALYAPYSRGKVSLVSGQTDIPPRIEFRLFEDPRDRTADAGCRAVCGSPVVRAGRGRYLQGRISATACYVPAPIQPTWRHRQYFGRRREDCVKRARRRQPPHHRQGHPAGPMVCQQAQKA